MFPRFHLSSNIPKFSSQFWCFRNLVAISTLWSIHRYSDSLNLSSQYRQIESPSQGWRFKKIITVSMIWNAHRSFDSLKSLSKFWQPNLYMEKKMSGPKHSSIQMNAMTKSFNNSNPKLFHMLEFEPWILYWLWHGT